MLQGRHPPSCVLSWPTKSPDLNPIEHVWDLLDRRVRARAIPLRNVRKLEGALVEEWGDISQQELANLVQSTRRRCSGTHYSISVSHMSVELVPFMSVVESCYVHTNIYTNKCS